MRLGPLVTSLGPSVTRLGPSVTRLGLSVTRLGPSVTRLGPSLTRLGGWAPLRRVRDPLCGYQHIRPRKIDIEEIENISFF